MNSIHLFLMVKNIKWQVNKNHKSLLFAEYYGLQKNTIKIFVNF